MAARAHLEAARTADGGLSICGHVHRITRAGERVARWLATDGGVLCALTAKRTKAVNRLTLSHAERIAPARAGDARGDDGRAPTSTRWTIELEGRVLLFEALSERDAAEWVAALSRIRERALAAPADLPCDAELRCVPLAPSRGAPDGGAPAPAEGVVKPRPSRAAPVAPEPPAFSFLKFFCACDLAPLAKARALSCSFLRARRSRRRRRLSDDETRRVCFAETGRARAAADPRQ